MKWFSCIFILFVFSFQSFADVYSDMSDYGSGYVVWESNRTGNWRIFYNTLDGSGEKQLSSGDNDRDHMSAQVSPDGKYVIYADFASGDIEWKIPPVGRLHIIDMAVNKDSVLFDACDYGGGHSVVWIDNSSFIYIDSARRTCIFDISTNKSIPLYDNSKEKFNLLFNTALTYGVCEYPAYVHSFNPQKQTAEIIKKLNGCMPFHTSDSKWIIWMENAGGPVGAYNPETDTIKHILDNRDKSLPEDRAYIYFPEVSYSMNAIAFGASPNQHNHNTSDYDIFVCRLDGKSMTQTGKPVRYSFDKGTDRFPSVFFEEHGLGNITLEGSGIVEWKLPEEKGSVTWNFGDGKTKKGGAAERHAYTPGVYKVEAKGSKIYKGFVTITPPEPPKVTAVKLVTSKNIRVTFSESINIGHIKLGLHSGVKITSFSLSDSKRVLDIMTDTDLTDDTLYMKNIYDLAQVPNKLSIALPLSANKYPLSAPLWGCIPDGHCMVIDGNEEIPPQFIGKVWYADNYGLFFAGGCLKAGSEISSALQKTGMCTFIFDICIKKSSDLSCFLNIAKNNNKRNLMISVEKGRLVLRARTALGVYEGNPKITLADLENNRNYHIALTYGNDIAVLYIDGQKINTFTDVQGNFDNWYNAELTIGSMPDASQPFCGAVNSFLVFDRVLTSEDIKEDYLCYKDLFAPYEPDEIKVSAVLEKESHIPTLDEIKPYRDALTVCTFLTDTGKRIRVISRVFANGEMIYSYKTGEKYELFLEPAADNPLIDSIYMSDTLDFDADAEEFYNLTLE